MSKIIDKTQELKENLYNEPEIVEFFRLKKLFENDKSLEEMRRQIIKAKQANNQEEYKRLKDLYDNHPLVSNYYAARENVADLLKELTDILKG